MKLIKNIALLTVFVAMAACKSGPMPQSDKTVSAEPVERPSKPLTYTAKREQPATPRTLFEAIRSGSPDSELVRLIESGADLNATNTEGVTPFMARMLLGL